MSHRRGGCLRSFGFRLFSLEKAEPLTTWLLYPLFRNLSFKEKCFCFCYKNFQSIVFWRIDQQLDVCNISVIWHKLTNCRPQFNFCQPFWEKNVICSVRLFFMKTIRSSLIKQITAQKKFPLFVKNETFLLWLKNEN